MGLVRKTVSIGTLGIVPFRSKKEKLRRAEKAHRKAEEALADEHAARAEVDKRLAAAEKRARQAELQALQQAKKADVAKGKRRERRRQGRVHAMEAIEDFVAAATPAMEDRAKELSRRGRRSAKRAAKRAEAAAAQARKEAKKQGRRAKKKVVDLTESTNPKLESLRADAVAKGSDLVDAAKTKASALADR
jgi:hypothetical protein